MTRLTDSLERLFRYNVAYPVLRMIFRNPVTDEPIDIGHVSRLLIFRYDRIGDMIVTTPILRILKKLNPQLKLDVLASKNNAEILLGNPFVDEVFVLESNWFRLAKQLFALRKKNFDVILNFIFNRTTGPGILANIIAPRGQKAGQGPDRYAFYFNRLVKVNRFNQHMLDSYLSMVEQTFGLSVSREDIGFDIEISAEAQSTVDEWLRKCQILRRGSEPEGSRRRYVILNPSGKDVDRSLNLGQVAALAETLSGRPQFRLVVLDAPGNDSMGAALRSRREFRESLIYRTHSATPLIELASLIEGAALVISPDTSIIHFASAMMTPVLAVYAPMNASQEWLPYRVEYDVIMAQEGQRVTEIEPQLIIQGADQLLTRVLQSDSAMKRESR